MKEKLTLYIDQKSKQAAKRYLAKTSFSSLSAFVEYQFNQLPFASHTKTSFAEKWGGVLQNKALEKLAQTDLRLAAILAKHTR
ncbi:MAG: DUF6364 family protein [Candidatus Margulisiibacteriota bacterium]